MEQFVPIVVTLAVVVAAAAVFLALRALRRGRDDAVAETAERLAAAQAELATRLSQLNENQIIAQNQVSERLQAQERAISKALDERLADVSKRVGDGLTQHAERTGETMKKVHERLAVIDAAQKNLTELSSQMVGLQEILSNKQARGAFGEIQLNDLVSSILPPSAYTFQTTLSSGARVDCLLKLPNPPGAIAIDAKFPLESYQRLRDAEDETARVQAGRAFSADVRKHVQDIAAKYIVPGETAESALMFLPSEAVYAELHAGFRNVVEESFRHRVWIVSPTTLMATLNTVRAVLKDARMREQAGLIQKEVHTLLKDVERLDDRVGNLQKHFQLASRDIEQVATSSRKITSRGERIQDLELGEEGPAAELEPPDTRLRDAGE
jgi:DNA recombination protein RmuC